MMTAELNLREQELIESFRKLDEDGCRLVEECIRDNIDRCSLTGLDLEDDAYTQYDYITRDNLFLAEEDEAYDSMHAEYNEMKSECGDSDELLELLWTNGYAGVLSISDMVALDRGDVAPSVSFASDIQRLVRM